MNISTYESRIKALEDQLNPPGPSGPETGLVSVVVTPDITLSDGTSLNAKLAAMMPKASGREVINENSLGALEADYRVTVKPGTDWYAYKSGTTFGAQGEQVYNDEHVESGMAFGTTAAATEDTSNQDAPNAVIRINITPGA